MRIAQITDLHVVAPGTLAYGRVDANRLLAEAIARVNGISPQPDMVVATGDLTDHGLPQEYAALRELLAQIHAPTFLVIGNHDIRENFRAALKHYAYMPDEGFIQYVADDLGPIRLIAIDTTSDAFHHGDFCEQRAAWLDARLSEAPDRPTVVACHHPPFDTGIKWMDGPGPGWAVPLLNVFARHPQIVRVVCGHLHRSIVAQVSGRVASVAPSTAHQVPPDLEPEFDIRQKLPELSLEPPGFQLHLWDGAHLVTHNLYVAEYERFCPIDRSRVEQLMGTKEDPLGPNASGKKVLDF